MSKTDLQGDVVAPVADDASTMTITRARALSYRGPKRRTKRGPRNYVIELSAVDADGAEIRGIGEGQPRGHRTGDVAGGSWEFLAAAAGQLHHQQVDVSTPEASLAHIRELVANCWQHAADLRDDDDGARPFRGTIMAVEIALLDVAARRFDLPLADLLGRLRDTAPLAPASLRTRLTEQEISQRLRHQAGRSEYTRLLGTAELDESIELMCTAAFINAGPAVAEFDKPQWIDFNGQLSEALAEQLLDRLVKLMVSGDLPSRLVVEQPVASEEVVTLPRLQRRADAAVAAAGLAEGSLAIMADEAIWDREDLAALSEVGAVRALNIRPAQAGGLLASLDLARAFHEVVPDAGVMITRMAGASRLTTTALRHLALAVPQVDSVKLGSTVDEGLTLVRTVDEAVFYDADRETEQAEPVAESGSNEGEAELLTSDEAPVAELATGGSEYDDEVEADADADADSAHYQLSVRPEPGLGLELVNANLIEPVINYATFPPPRVPVHDGAEARQYDDVDFIRPLGAYATHGHIVEREALAYGLNTRRFNKTTFMADDGEHPTLTFRTARWPLSSAAAASIVRHKESTRILLDQFGCPVPKGRTFSHGDGARALEYAERIGYPVVLKPAAGSMGVGVTADIQNAEELGSALERLEGSTMGHGEFIVEQHIHGRDYRIMVLGQEVVAAVERVPASVLGDGVSSLAELILAKNSVRKQNSHLGPLKLKWNATSIYETSRLGYTADSVIPDGERVFLNSANNLTQGGDSIEILDDLHPSIIEASIKAVQAIPGLAYCGVDFLLEDHTRPLAEQEGAVCELNAVAAIPVAEYPMFGTPRPLSEKFFLRSADVFDVAVSAQRAEHLTLQLEVKGRVTGVGYRRWFARRARQHGCVGSIRNRGRRRVEIKVAGPTVAVSALVTAAILGPSRALPTSVRTTHLDEDLGDSFEVITVGGEGLIEAEDDDLGKEGAA